MQEQIINDETLELLEHVCLRPRMFYREMHCFRDLLAFINGISCGIHPPHGCLCIHEFVRNRFQTSRDVPWTTVVLNEFGDLPFHDACEALAQLFRDFRATLE